MKYCTHCGTELFDEIKICTACGCPLEIEEKPILNESKKDKKVKLLLIIVAAVAAIALIIGGFFIVNHIRRVNIIKELSGERFEYNGDTSYSIKRERYTFDDEGNCEDYSYFYGITMDEPMEYTFNWTYKIEYKKNSAYVVLSNDDKLKIKYDEDGEIISLYDSEGRKTYERE